MSFDDIMKKAYAENPPMISLVDVPDKVEVKILAYEQKIDNQGERALFLTLGTKDDRSIIQKYTKTSYRQLYDAIVSAGGFDYLKDTYVTWQKSNVGQMKNQRLLPLPKKEQKK